MFQQSSCPECRHLLASGRKCHAPAMRGKAFCYSHLRGRTLVDANRSRRHSIVLPPIEDRASLLMGLNEVIAGLGSGKINRRTAGTYLASLQLGERLLSGPEPLISPDPVILSKTADGDIVAAEEPAGAPVSACAGRQESAACAGQLSEAASEPAPEQAFEQQPESRPEESQLSPLLDERNTRATHEYDPEPPPPPTKAEIRHRLAAIDADLRNYRETLAYYSKPAILSDPNENPAMVRDYLQPQIDKLEAEREALVRTAAPDPEARLEPDSSPCPGKSPKHTGSPVEATET